jgi:hypothetical protein
MAQFYGSLQGSRGEATRLGTKKSGLETTAASWEGAVNVRLYHDHESGLDMARVYLSPWHGSGTHLELYHGPVKGELINS